MYDKNSVHPEIEAGSAFRPHMNDKIVIDFNIKTFSQHGNDSAILKLK